MVGTTKVDTKYRFVRSNFCDSAILQKNNEQLKQCFGGELCLSCVLVGTVENPTQVGFKLCLSYVLGRDRTRPTDINTNMY